MIPKIRNLRKIRPKKFGRNIFCKLFGEPTITTQHGTVAPFALRNQLYRVRIWLLVNGKKQIKNTFSENMALKWFGLSALGKHKIKHMVQ